MERYKMIKEIYETPLSLRKLFESEKDNIDKIADNIRKYNPTFAILAGRGSSDNACIYGQYILESIAKLPVSFAAGSIYALYKSPPNILRGLVIGISQSGETEDVRAVIDYSERKKVISVVITNSKESTLYNLAKENKIYLHAGKEESVCATKSFSASMIALLMLAFSLNKERLDIEKIIDPVEEILTNRDRIMQIAQQYIFSNNIVVLGTGFSYSVALETALKLKEACYINAIGMSSVDFVHGPIAILTPTTPVIIYAPDDPTLEVNLSVINEIRQIGSHVLVISDNEEVTRKGDLGFIIPKSKPFIYPFTETIFAHMFAFYLSISRKINPDTPRYLHKVTKLANSHNGKDK